MAVFVINTDIKTDVADIEVTSTPTSRCRWGVSASAWSWSTMPGNVSSADEVEVIIADQSAPTAVLKAPKVAAFGTSFNLDGSSPSMSAVARSSPTSGPTWVRAT